MGKTDLLAIYKQKDKNFKNSSLNISRLYFFNRKKKLKSSYLKWILTSYIGDNDVQGSEQLAKAYSRKIDTEANSEESKKHFVQLLQIKCHRHW